MPGRKDTSRSIEMSPQFEQTSQWSQSCRNALFSACVSKCRLASTQHRGRGYLSRPSLDTENVMSSFTSKRWNSVRRQCSRGRKGFMKTTLVSSTNKYEVRSPILGKKTNKEKQKLPGSRIFSFFRLVIFFFFDPALRCSHRRTCFFFARLCSLPHVAFCLIVLNSFSCCWTAVQK